MTKRPGFPASKSSFSAGGALALLAGAGLLVASALSFQDSPTQTEITVNPNTWSYLSQIRFGLDHADVSEEMLLGLDEETFPQSAATLAFDKPLVIRKVQKARHHATHFPAPVARPVVAMTTQDRVPTTQAHAAAVEVSPAAPTVSVYGSASPGQLEAFQKMHRLLRVQLFTALHTHTPVVAEQLNTQSVPTVVAGDAAQESASEVAATAGEASQSEEETSIQVAAAAPTESAPIVAPAIQLMPALDSNHSAGAEFSSAVAKKVSKHSQRVVTQRNGQSNGQSGVPPHPYKEESSLTSASVTSNSLAGYESFLKQTEGTYRQLSVLSQQTFAPAHVTTHAMTEAPVSTVATQILSPSNALLVSPVPGYSRQVEYSTTDLYKMWKAWNARNQAAPVAAPRAPVAPPAPAIALAQNFEKSFLIAQAAEDKATVTDAPEAVVPSAPMVVEAFEWNTAVADSSRETITLEGWTRLQAADHWPVIFWNPDSQSQAAMISHNTAVMLSKFADTELQPDAAIVFGKIPMGWEVEYSDRAEKVVYLNAQNQLDATPENVRYFAFVNAAPGAQVITLKAAIGAETAAVVVPVLNGNSTFVDLTAVSKRALSGYVLDASAQTRTGIASASIGVVGQPNAVFFTTESGYFHLSEVYAVGTYPVFVEMTTPVGFKHRYRVAPGKMEGLDLYRLNDDQVRGWVSQLEGGVSPDSGLVVAAMPSLVHQYGDGRLFPSTHTLLGNATLTPETYTISSGGALEEGKPLEAAAPRFVSVQIPSGPVVSQVEDNNQNVVWSELVLAQPGVISIVGPY